MSNLEKSTEQTVQEPGKVLKVLQEAMGATENLPAKEGPSMSGTLPSKDQGTGVKTTSTLLESQASQDVKSIVQAVTKPEPPIQTEKRTRISPTVNIPHKPENVQKWIGTVTPGEATGEPDVGAHDEEGSLYEGPGPVEEHPSDAGSVRSELNMFRLYVETQLEESRKYMESQMRSTHDLLTKIETRLSLLERRVVLPVQRQVSVQLPTPSITQQPSAPTAPPTAASAQTATQSSATYGGLTILPSYSPNKTIQTRIINRGLSNLGVTLQPLEKSIPRKDWTLQYINSLPVYKY